MSHSAETKGKVLAELLAGETLHKVAEKYGVSRTTLRRWHAEAGTPTGGRTLIQAPGRRDLGELIGGYLEQALLTLAAQAKFFRDPDWLKQQSAADVAILHGVVHDKTLRVLAALERPEEGIEVPVPRGEPIEVAYLTERNDSPES
jgi:transposase-like protein